MIKAIDKVVTKDPFVLIIDKKGLSQVGQSNILILASYKAVLTDYVARCNISSKCYIGSHNSCCIIVVRQRLGGRKGNIQSLLLKSFLHQVLAALNSLER